MTKKRAKHGNRPSPQESGQPSRQASQHARPGNTALFTPVVLSAVLLIAAGAIAYANSFAGVLVLDDVRAIARNSTIRTLWPLSSPMSPPGESTVAGRPVANLSFAVNYALAPSGARDVFEPEGPAALPGQQARFLDNVWGYHALNLIIHLASALLVFGIVRRTFLSKPLSERFGGRFASAATGLALVTSAVWVVHPLNTAAVTYLVQRVESLMGLFYLLTMYCAIRVSSGGRVWWTVGAIVACALGMATKEVMVTAPVVVALWLHVFGNVRDRSVRPLIVGLAATWLVFAALVWHEHRAASIDFTGVTTWSYLLTQAQVIVHYLRLAFVPHPLVFLYTWPLASSVTDVLPHAVLLIALAALTLVGLVRRHPLGFAGAWFFVILAPTSSVVPIVTEVAAEHRMYLPLAGVVACAVALAYATWQHAARRLPQGNDARQPRQHKLGITIAAIATMVIVAFGIVQTRERNRDYWSAEQLWRDTVEKQPQNQRARVAYGEALAAARRYPDAETQYRAAVDLVPGDPIALVRLGSVLAAQRKLDEATPFFERALAVRPDDADANRAVGMAYAVRRQDARAVPHLERALATRPDDPFLLGQLASILAESPDASVRDGRRAVEVAERAARVTARQDPIVLEILAVSLAATNRVSDAASVAREALLIARRQGNTALASRLEQRVSSYDVFTPSMPGR